MSATDFPDISSASEQRSGAPRWPVSVLLPSILAAAAFAEVHVLNRTIYPPVLSLATTVGLGLIAGLSTRREMRERAGVWRVVAALAATSVALLLLGLLTRGQAGVGPWDRPLYGPDWAGLGRFALGAWAALLALRAWPSTAAGESSALDDDETSTGAGQAFHSGGSALQRGMGRVNNWLDRTQAWIQGYPHVPSAPAPAATVHIAHTAPAPAPVRIHRQRGRSFFNHFRGLLGHPSGARPKLSLRRKRRYIRSVRLTGAEQPSCPYCFEEIKPNDPRGVVECPICHTRHHGDCWAITGMCQIPHQQALN